MLRLRFAHTALRKDIGRLWRGAKTRAKKTEPSTTAATEDAAAASASATQESLSWSALNIVKGGTGPPKQPLDAYPDWLWTLLAPENSLPLGVLQQRFQALIAEGGVTKAEQALGPQLTQRLLKLQNRAEIKKRNAEGVLL